MFIRPNFYNQKRIRKNQDIRAPEVFLVEEDGKKIGVVSLAQALELATERNTDLIEVSPQANPPVCKLVDFGKYLYRQEKAERKQKARQKKVEIKGIRLTLKIGKHDLEVKRNKAWEFINEGHKVRLELFLRGRERAHSDLAREILQNFQKDLGEKITIEQQIIFRGGKLTSIIAKKK